MASKSAVLYRNIHESPYHVVEAAGIHLTLSDGRQIIDASGGAAVSCLGHGDERIRKVMTAQTSKLDYCHSLFFSCDPSEELSRSLIESTDGAMARVFIVNSGSEAMDAALKLARQYFWELDHETHRTKFIARHGSYHGNTLGALGISGHKVRRSIYEPMLSLNISHVSACNAYRGMDDREDIGMYVDRLAEELDQEFRKAGPETVCAFVAEPVVGAALGCAPSVPGYFKAMKTICDKYGALLILDEVMCGMGRTGTMHAWQQEDIVPDIQTIGKGLGAGYVPVAGLIVGHRVINALDSGTGQFVHGQTYQAHPMVCAVAHEVQRIIKSEGLVAKAKSAGKTLELKLRKIFHDHPYVGDIRGRGLFWALEFVKNRTLKQPFDPVDGVAFKVHNEGILQDPGIMMYPGSGSADGLKGDHIIIAPPYNVTEEQIEVIVKAARRAVDSVFEKCQDSAI